MTTTTSGGGVDAASGDGPASRSLLLLDLKRASTRAIAPVDLHYIHCDLAFPSSCPRPAHLDTRPPTASLEGRPPVRHVLATPLDRLDSMTFWDDRHRSGHCAVSQRRLCSALFSLLFSFAFSLVLAITDTTDTHRQIHFPLAFCRPPCGGGWVLAPSTSTTPLASRCQSPTVG